jgi:hypothetical protein
MHQGNISQCGGVAQIDVAMFKVKPAEGSLAVGAVDLMIEPTMVAATGSAGTQ